MLEITAPFQTMKSIQELSTPALLVNSAHCNISLEDFGKSATITAKQSIIESHRLRLQDYKIRVNRQPCRKADWFVAGLRLPKNSP